LKLIIFGYFFLFTKIVFSQHIGYNDLGTCGNILVGDVMINSTIDDTYYEVHGWNQGANAGGYTGIQTNPMGNDFIYSLWNPSNWTPAGPNITLVYAETGAEVGPFGGEGTGMHFLSQPSKGGSSWKLNQWYTLFTRNWQNGKDTYFALWKLDQTAKAWTQLVTFSFPLARQCFSYGEISFLENYCGCNKTYTRFMFTKEMWKNYTTTGWQFLNHGSFDVNTTGGVIKNSYYMETGPNAIPNIHPSNSDQTVPTPSYHLPQISTGQLSSCSLSYSSDTLTVNWVVITSTAPQFSYQIQIFDNSVFRGSPLITESAVVAHIRTLAINISSLPKSKTYHVRVRINDIMNRLSNYVTSSIKIPKSHH